MSYKMIETTPALESLRTKYADCGYPLSLSSEEVDVRLRKLLGKGRYETLMSTGAADDFVMNYEVLYDLAETPEELHVMLACRANLYCDLASGVYDLVRDRLVPGSTVIDLGCSTGCSLAWMAEHHPDCTFVGVDAESKPIRFAKQLCVRPNLVFAPCTYERAARKRWSFDVLISVFGMSASHVLHRFQPSCSVHLDRLGDCRASGYSQVVFEQFFDNARTLANPEATLVCVFDQPTLEHFIGMIRAAEECGWSLDREQSTLLLREQNGGHVGYYAMCFSAEDSPTIGEKEIVDLWCEGIQPQIESVEGAVTLHGDTAIQEYLSLDDKKVLGGVVCTSKEGSLWSTENGVLDGSVQYSIKRDRRGRTRLKLVSEKQERRVRKSPEVVLVTAG